MPTAPASPPARRRGLPRPFVALCIAVAAVVALYTVLSLTSLLTASTEHRTRTFEAVERLRVETGSGDVEVVGEARSDVRVEMEIQRGMFRGAWKPDVDMRADGRSLQLASRCSVWEHIGVTDCGASFTIRVPRGTAVELDASSGDVVVADVDGAVQASASSGDVRARDLGGSAELSASSGEVEVDGYRGRRISARTSSGDVDVRAVAAPRRLVASASSGDVAVLVPDRAYRVEADADSGDVDVQVRQDPDSPRTIEARASSGDVSVQRLLAR